MWDIKKGWFEGVFNIIILLLNQMTETEGIEREGLLIGEVVPTTDAFSYSTKTGF